jgi:protein involved in polysaccharide export with SLBB domain
MPSSRALDVLKMSLLLGLGLLGSAESLLAQNDKVKAPPARVEATRAELEAIAAHPPKGMSGTDLGAVQSRLANGDFAVGDRILIEVVGDSIYSDTFTVRSGRALVLPSLPPLSLEGVLRSESDSVISGYLTRYLRNPQVTVTPLIRMGLLGGVVRPGYYDVPAQSLITEVVMLAGGGLAGTGDMSRTVVYRGNTVVLDSKAANAAAANGSTLDVLNLQSGDNINIGVKNPGGTLTKVQIITGLLAIPLMILSISAIAN